MERLLTKTRAILALAVVMFVAALNRQESVVYAMAVLLAAVGVLGYVMPWAALRGTTLRARQPWRGEVAVAEGQPLELSLELHHAGWWPAWLVEVEAVWSWAGREFVSRDVVPYLAPRGRVAVLRTAAFGCRGSYRLERLRVGSGFPLGLVRAQRDVRVGALTVIVHPAPAPVGELPRWTVSEDLSGDASIGRSGESTELSMLRPYEPGASVRHVDWRASARAGGLVVRQFEHPASAFVKVTVEPPRSDDVGRGDAPSEHAMRVAASACARLAAQGVRFSLLLPGALPAHSVHQATRAIATAAPAGQSWPSSLREAARGLRRGEQMLAVLTRHDQTGAVVHASRVAASAGGRVVALIATAPQMDAGARESALLLQKVLQEADVETVLAWS